MAVDLRQTHFRFGIDELTESTHGWLAAEDTNIFLLPDVTFLLRFTEQESGGTALANCDAQFQYNRNGLGWNNITTSSAVARAVAATALTNGGHCTKRLSGTGTFETTGAGQTEDGSSGGTANDIAASGNSETECGLRLVGADVVRGDVIQFRFTSPDATVTYTVTPQLTVLGNVSVAADSGAFSADGVAASLLRSHIFTSDAGGFSLEGVAAGLLYGRQVAADVGSFSVLGTAANLTKGFFISAEAGAFGIAGEDVTMTVESAGYTLGVDPGSFSMAGEAAGLTVQRKADASAGALQASGVDANLLYSRIVSAVSGVFGVTGGAATLSASRNVVVDVGGFNMTGVLANLLKDSFLTAASGSFTASGQEASLVKGRILQVASGDFNASGEPANLRKSSIVDASSGNAGILGEEASLKKSSILGAESTVVVLSGASLDLFKFYLLSLQPGSIAAQGFDAELSYDGGAPQEYSLDAAAGSLEILGSSAALDVSPVSAPYSPPTPKIPNQEPVHVSPDSVEIRNKGAVRVTFKESSYKHSKHYFR